MRFAFLFSWAPLALVGGMLLGASPVRAQTTLISGLGGVAGYGTQCLGQNDDGSSNAVDITPYFPDGLNFFGTVQRTIFINTNGNITFAGGVPSYTPSPFPVAARPMIAPYWADVDTRHYTGGWFFPCSGPDDGEAVMGPACDNPSQNGIWWNFSPGRLVVTWDRVGYYQCNEDKRMTFQLVLSAAEGCAAPGDFDVEFRYTQCNWETGDASGGSSGFGGTPAQAGFDAGNSRDYVMIPGSRMAGIARHLCDASNVGINGTWRFEVRAGVITCPDAGMPCTIPGLLGACAEGRTNCVGGGTECVQQIFPSEERCDGIDNDCDGEVDEVSAAAICGDFESCIRGTCTPICFEGGCSVGQTCTDVGCVEDACVDVACEAGQRCEGGSCVGACDGVVCPHGQSCREGRCFDPCAGVTCDACGVCEGGSCVPPCTSSSCPAGQSCQADGHCIETACTTMTCPVGTYCRDGGCHDLCEGVRCPYREMCREGACVPEEPAVVADAGVPTGEDAGPADASTEGLADASTSLDASRPGVDAGRRRAGGSSDCRCRAAGYGDGSSPLLPGLALFGLALAIARRRRR